MPQPSGPPVVVVNVHGVGPVPRGATADEQAYWVTRDELASVLDSVAVSSVPVRVTCDDGFSSDVDLVLPLLRERGLHAAFFPCAGWLDRPGRVGVEGVHQLLAAGMSVGSHGWSHRDWRSLTDAEADEEFIRSRDVLGEVVGAPVLEAAVPFGRYDRLVLRRLAAAGFDTVYTSDGGLARAGSPRVPRTSVRPGVGRGWLGELVARERRPDARARRWAARTIKAARG